MGYGLNSRFRINLATARTGNGEKFDLGGKKIAGVAASSITAFASVVLIQDGYSAAYDLYDQGYIQDGDGFNGFFIANEAQPGAWIEFTVSNPSENVDFEYFKPTQNTVASIATPVMVTGGKTAVTGAAAVDATVGGVLILAANANRTGWSLHNNSGLTLYIGPQGLTAANGYPILPGEKYGEDGREAIYGLSTGACDVRYREVSI